MHITHRWRAVLAALALTTSLAGYSAATAPPAAASSSFATTISAGTTIGPDQKVCSPNGHCILMQGNGDAFVYAPGAIPIWHTATVNNPGARLVFQTDGNLVVYSRYNKVLWAMNKSARPARLDMQNDGNLVAYNTSGSYWGSFYDAGSDFYVGRMVVAATNAGCPDAWQQEVLYRRTSTQHTAFRCGWPGYGYNPTLAPRKGARATRAQALASGATATQADSGCWYADPYWDLHELELKRYQGPIMLARMNSHHFWCADGGVINDLRERSFFFDHLRWAVHPSGNVLQDEVRGLNTFQVTSYHSEQIEQCLPLLKDVICIARNEPRMTVQFDANGYYSTKFDFS